MNPKYYDKMSSLLDALIEQRRKEALDYANYLEQLLDFAAQVGTGASETKYPEWASSSAKRALVDFDWPEEVDPQFIYETIQASKEHGWTGNLLKQHTLRSEEHTSEIQ